MLTDPRKRSCSSPPPPPARRLPLFSRGRVARGLRVTELLRETVGGALLLLAIALVWANSSWADSYAALRDTVGHRPCT